MSHSVGYLLTSCLWLYRAPFLDCFAIEVVHKSPSFSPLLSFWTHHLILGKWDSSKHRAPKPYVNIKKNISNTSVSILVEPRVSVWQPHFAGKTAEGVNSCWCCWPGNQQAGNQHLGKCPASVTICSTNSSGLEEAVLGPQKQSFSQHNREAEVLWVQICRKLWLCCLQNCLSKEKVAWLWEQDAGPVLHHVQRWWGECTGRLRAGS